MNEGKEFYYVKYVGPGIDGAAVIAQFKPKDGGENPDGMNLATANSILCNMFKTIVVIQWWTKITEKRKNDFEDFVKSVTGDSSSSTGAVSRHLSLVPTPPIDLF